MGLSYLFSARDVLNWFSNLCVNIFCDSFGKDITTGNEGGDIPTDGHLSEFQQGKEGMAAYL